MGCSLFEQPGRHAVQHERSTRAPTGIVPRMVRDQRGITIVELVITVVILGVLMTSIMIRGIDLANTAQAGACRAIQKTLETAQQFFFTQSAIAGTAEYADAISELTPYIGSGEIPLCPADGVYQLLDGGVVRCSITSHQP